MQRVKHKENMINSNSIKLSRTNSNINQFQNRNKNNVFNKNILKKDKLISNRSNKFMSIPEKEKINNEIARPPKNYKYFYERLPQDTEIFSSREKDDNANVLYIKKTKTNANLFSKKEVNSTNFPENRNKKANMNKIKFTENKNLVNKTIKEYYKKVENPFKTYLKSLNNESKDNINFKYQKNTEIKPNFISDESEKNKNNQNYFYESTKGNTNVVKEIYKKPINRKTYKVNANINDNGKYNNIIGEDNDYINSRNNIYDNLHNSAKMEKINCAKIMNNNGIKKNIINYINNFNTKTIQKDSKDNLSNMKSNDKKYIDYYRMNNTSNNIDNNEFLTKTKSSVNIGIKKNNVILKHKGINGKNSLYEDIKSELEGRKDKLEEFYIKNNSCNKNNTNLCIYKSINLEDDVNNKTSSTNDYYVTYNFKNNELNERNSQRMFYSLNSNNTNKNIINLQYSKKNIKNSVIYGIKSQALKNNLPQLVIDDDITPFSENENRNKIIGQKYMKDINMDFLNNNNYYNEKEFYNNLDNDINNNRIINTETKQKNINRNKTYTLEDISKNKNKINKSFSYSIENDEQNGNYNYNYNFNFNNNLQYQNGKSMSPFYKRYKPNKYVITKEIIFPSGVNKNNSFYNSDDDIMNSFNNSNSNEGRYNDNNNFMPNINNHSFDNNIKLNNYNYNNYRMTYSNSNNNNNIFELNKNPTKDYYFNYLSNKINNDFINENKINKLENNLYNQEFKNTNIYCEKCNRNYCPYCHRLTSDSEIYNDYVNNKEAPSRYVNINNYHPKIIHSKNINMNSESNNLKNKNIPTKYVEENKEINKRLLTSNIDLKLDVSNGKHSSENLNINANRSERGSFNSNNNENNENNFNSNTKNYSINNELEEEISKTRLEINERLNEINRIEINLENEKKYINEYSQIEKEKKEDKNKDIIFEINTIENLQQKINEINIDKNNEIISNNFIDKNNNNTDEKNKNSSNNNKDFNSIIINKEEVKDKEEKQDEIKNTNIILEAPSKNKNLDFKERSNDDKYNIIDNNSTIKSDLEIINERINNKNITINENLMKIKYLNNKNQSESPVLSDILFLINIISTRNFFKIKNKILNLLINNGPNIPMQFVNLLYPIAIHQKIYQPIYAKLCKDIDKYYNKKDKNKSKSIIRTQLMKLCKTNFRKIKVLLENITYIVNDINFIGELINVQMVSKKVGLQCLTHLVNKFNQYNTDKKLINKKNEKYIYLNCIINLLNQFVSCVYYYQNSKIRQDELLLFEKEIKNNINILKEISNNQLNNDIPKFTKMNLLKLINKSNNNWEFTLIEKYKNQLIKPIYEESDKNNNLYLSDLKYEYNNANDKYKNSPNNRQFNFSSPHNKINVENEPNKQKQTSYNYNNKYILQKISSDNTKIIENNLILFKNHINKYQSGDDFKNWEAIDNLFQKLKKCEIFKNIVEACFLFTKSKDDIYYIDIYIKIVFEYYSNYLKANNIKDIPNLILEEIGSLSQISDELDKKEENNYKKEIWILIIYYLLENKIMTMNDFNYFCKEHNKEAKINIINFLYKICCYNEDNKDIYLKEFKNIKFASINKKILSDILKET